MESGRRGIVVRPDAFPESLSGAGSLRYLANSRFGLTLTDGVQMPLSADELDSEAAGLVH